MPGRDLEHLICHSERKRWKVEQDSALKHISDVVGTSCRSTINETVYFRRERGPGINNKKMGVGHRCARMAPFHIGRVGAALKGNAAEKTNRSIRDDSEEAWTGFVFNGNRQPDVTRSGRCVGGNCRPRHEISSGLQPVSGAGLDDKLRFDFHRGVTPNTKNERR